MGKTFQPLIKCFFLKEMNKKRIKSENGQIKIQIEDIPPHIY